MQNMRNEAGSTCVLYCRVSSYDQIEGTSLESQERVCREFADRQGWQVLETFVERGESAKTANRTELNRAIVFCKKKQVDFFVVYKLDRFARNQDDHVSVRALLRRSGTELRSVTEPIDETPIGRAMEGILSVFAEFDNNVRTERTKQGMQERIRQGIWVWPSPLGYYRPSNGKGSNIAPDPKTAPFIRMAFEEYAKGIYNFESLARVLAERGFRTALGCKPRRQLLERIIKNPVYCGIIQMWGEEHRATFEPIVSEELFESCNAICNGRAKLAVPHVSDNPLFPLRRLVICKVCREPFTGSSPTGRNNVRYPYYHHYHHGGCRVSRSIPKATFEDRFAEYLQSITPDARFEKLFREVLLDAWRTDYSRREAHNVALQKELAALELERQQVFDLHRRGTYNNEDFRDQLRVVQQKKKQKHLLLRENVPVVVDLEQVLNFSLQYIRQTAEVWKELEANPSDRLRFQRQVFDGFVEFDGEAFGNAALSLVYRLNRESGGEKSRLVVLVDQHWNQVLETLRAWAELRGPGPPNDPVDHLS